MAHASRLGQKNKEDDVKASVKYKKIDTKEIAEENFERKTYMTDLRMDQARTKFKIKTKMIKNVKLNYKNDPKNVKALWKCSECALIDSQEHLLWCDGFEMLRKNKDLTRDNDLTSYFQQIMKIRDKSSV